MQREGGRALPLACDVRDPVAVAAAVQAVADAFGGIDVVVNNAGALDLRPTAKLPPKNLRWLLEVNVDGPFAVVQAALPHLRRSANAHMAVHPARSELDRGLRHYRELRAPTRAAGASRGGPVEFGDRRFD